VVFRKRLVDIRPVSTNQSTVPAAFGYGVRWYREEAGLTPKELGQRARLTPAYLRRVERGEADLSIATIFDLAGGLGIPASKLMDVVDALRRD
jgi:transcriptional regulator with XRE-family HTH domain